MKDRARGPRAPYGRYLFKQYSIADQVDYDELLEKSVAPWHVLRQSARAQSYSSVGRYSSFGIVAVPVLAVPVYLRVF